MEYLSGVKAGDKVLTYNRWTMGKGLVEREVERITDCYLIIGGCQFYKSNGVGRGHAYGDRIVENEAAFKSVITSERYRQVLRRVDSDELRKEIISLVEERTRPKEAPAVCATEASRQDSPE